jgi:lysophospholipase
MARALPAVLLLLILAACGRGGAREPFAESQVPASLAPRFQPPEGWAWGYVQAGDHPIQRYGVAGPAGRVPHATVVILPGYEESAEAWFETVRALLAEGDTVWVLERAGQGGSERYGSPRDLGFVTGFDPDVANLRALVRVVIRPGPNMPVILLAHADGAVVALRALETGLAADGLVASSPRLDMSRTTQPFAARLGLGALKPPGWKGWTRERPDDLARRQTHDAWRGKVQMAWQTANPDLRMAGPGPGWTAAHQAASRATSAEIRRVAVPVLMLQPGAAGSELCGRMPDCRPITLPGGWAKSHLEDDRWRKPWLAQVSDFIDGRVQERGAPAPVIRYTIP